MPTSATVYTTWLCKCQGTRKTAQRFGDAERTLWTTAEKAGILRRNLPVLQTLAHKSHTLDGTILAIMCQTTATSYFCTLRSLQSSQKPLVTLPLFCKDFKKWTRREVKQLLTVTQQSRGLGIPAASELTSAAVLLTTELLRGLCNQGRFSAISGDRWVERSLSACRTHREPPISLVPQSWAPQRRIGSVSHRATVPSSGRGRTYEALSRRQRRQPPDPAPIPQGCEQGNIFPRSAPALRCAWAPREAGSETLSHKVSPVATRPRGVPPKTPQVRAKVLRAAQRKDSFEGPYKAL